MLLERLTYADDFPMNITVANIMEDPLHYHLDIEIIYVLQGSIRLKNGYCWYELHAGDTFVNSGHEVHSLYAISPDNVVAQLQISTHYYSQFFPNLSKSCYRTYSRRPEGKKHDLLRELLLQILLKHTTRSFNYRSECIYLMANTIKHLDKYFNLFSFDKDVVVDFDKSNPVAIERISRISQYIYQYYADNITLEDLSAMEHLNTFHLSHLIKRFTGMNFRDFLCFARVEWSEIPLLDSDARISRIAREVGFSTTAYYKKYFQKWFKRTPEEHRAYYMPLVKGDLRPAVMKPLPGNQAVSLIRRVYANYNMKKCDDAVISSINLEVNVDADAPAQGYFEQKLTVIVTVEDYQALGMRMFSLLESLEPWQVVLLYQDGDDPELLSAVTQLLQMTGLSIQSRAKSGTLPAVSAGYDTILYPIYLFQHCLQGNGGTLEVFLRDSDTGTGVLRGENALVTANGVCKPAFYLCQAISHTRGSIISKRGQCCVIRDTREKQPVLKLFVSNAKDQLLSLCQPGSGMDQVKSAIHEFKDEISVDVCIRLPPGAYAVSKYSLNKEENIFAYLSGMDFPQQAAAFSGRCPEWWSGTPRMESYFDDVRTVLNIHFLVRGAGIQMATICAMNDRR